MDFYSPPDLFQYHVLIHRWSQARDPLFRCVPEMTFGKFRLDALSIKPWPPYETIGFEIKRTRQDFKTDQKWTNYLHFVNQFYFVSTPDVIQKTDLTEQVGLLYPGIMDGEKKLICVKPARVLKNSSQSFVLDIFSGLLRNKLDVLWKLDRAKLI